MSYVKHILQPGELVLAIGKLHWIIFVQAAFWLICAAVLVVASAHYKYGDYQFPLLALGLVCLVLGLYSGIRNWWKRFTTEIAVTNTRVIHKTGFIQRQTKEMNMDKVESVIVDQSILGRILDYGTISINGTGHGFERLKLIAHAIQLRNSITSR